ncbi:hypothetical protein [Nostoc spongiaeforme]|nr:hypothetical protein [Nostoc spongiaeforme]
MSRQQPPKKGKPRQTEPGAIRFSGQIDKINQQNSNKIDKPE